MSDVSNVSSEPTMATTPDGPPSERTRVRRLADLAAYERAVIDVVLDAAIVGHLGFVDDSGQPFVVPVAVARRGDEVLIHGSIASRLLRSTADGRVICLTVTHVDGVVVARSLFESSLRYRSVMILGNARAVDDLDDALEAFSEHLLPGRRDEVRRSSRTELRQTAVVAVDLSEASAKVSDGWPDDSPDDIAGDAWAGVIPLRLVADAPIAAPDLRSGIAVPPSVAGYVPPG